MVTSSQMTAFQWSKGHLFLILLWKPVSQFVLVLTNVSVPCAKVCPCIATCASVCLSNPDIGNTSLARVGPEGVWSRESATVLLTNWKWLGSWSFLCPSRWSSAGRPRRPHPSSRTPSLPRPLSSRWPRLLSQQPPSPPPPRRSPKPAST